jgi:hypothetical protein
VRHLLFIYQTIEADSGTQGSGPQKCESEPISLSAYQPISLLIALNVVVTWHPKTQFHPVVIREILQCDNQHWCRSLDEIVYEDRANNAALQSEHIQIVMLCMFALRQ